MLKMMMVLVLSGFRVKMALVFRSSSARLLVYFLYFIFLLGGFGDRHSLLVIRSAITNIQSHQVGFPPPPLVPHLQPGILPLLRFQRLFGHEDVQDEERRTVSSCFSAEFGEAGCTAAQLQQGVFTDTLESD